MAGEFEIVGLDEIFRKALAPHLARLSDGTAYDIVFTVPITKVDSKSRTVEGIATSEIRDLQGEQVSYDASKQAFKNWQGNVRQMHQNDAVGRAVSIQYDDHAKNITVKSRISRGSEDVWIKCQEGVLRAYSIGGTRLRSTMLPDGTRRTDEYRLNELSLVDSPANPDCSIKIVKSLLGTPTFTDVAARDDEADFHGAADACEQVAQTLRCGVRPLPTEVSRALFLCGSPVICNQLDLQDLRQKGPGFAKQISDCAEAMRKGDESQAERARQAAAFVLCQLPCRRDLAKWRGKTGGGPWTADSRGISVEQVRSQIEKAVGMARSAGHADAVEKLEVSAMALHSVAQAAGGVSKGMFSEQDLIAAREDLRAKLDAWHKEGKPQNVPAYRTLSDQFFIVNEKLKAK